MNEVTVRIYAQLNRFLPEELRQHAFRRTIDGFPSVKNVIESLGIPHTEVDFILANGVPVDFAYTVRDGDRLSVFPVFRSIDITSVTMVRPAPGSIRFVLDGHLGKLATLLRMSGFDAVYMNDAEDRALANFSADQNRILLTRDRGLLKRKQVTRGYCVVSDDPETQLTEVLQRYDLFGKMKPFSRCLICNTLLEPAAKQDVISKIPELIADCYSDFKTCPTCGRVYWKGTQYDRMNEYMRRFGASETEEYD